MNNEIKALLNVAFDVAKVVDSVIKKESFTGAIIPQLYQVASEIPGAINGFAGLKGEINGLSGTEAEADLVAFVASRFATVDSNVKAQGIVSASLKLISDLAVNSVALSNAIKA